MKRQLVIAACLVVAACTSAGQKAENEYSIVAAHGGADEKCTAAQKVEAAYLSEGDAHNYEQWRIRASLDCNEAQIERLSAGA